MKNIIYLCRHARLLTDILLVYYGAERFSWGVSHYIVIVKRGSAILMP